MAKIDRIEDLKVWQKSMDFCDEVFTLIQTTDLVKDIGLRDQMNRSSISIPSNIAEGFERNRNKSFIYFLKVAKGSAGELKTQLHLAKRRSYITESDFQKLEQQITEISKMVGSFISYLRMNEQNNELREPEMFYSNSN